MKIFFLFFLLIISFVGLAFLDYGNTPVGKATAYQPQIECKYLDVISGQNCFWAIQQRGLNCEPAADEIPAGTRPCESRLK